MIRFIFIFFWIFLISPSWAAITSLGDLGSANSAASGTTLVITTTATAEVGNEITVHTGFNNTSGTDADNSEITSIVDSAGNTYAKLCEYTNGETGAGTGITASLYKARVTSQLSSGGTITITYANTITARAARAWEWSATNALELVGTCQQAAGDNIDPPSQSISGLSSAETLFIRVIGEEEGSDDADLTVTTDYTVITMARELSTGASAGAKIFGEFIIATATGHTSNPSHTNDGDTANLFLALRESTGTTTRKISSIMY